MTPTKQKSAREIADKILSHGSNELHRILARAYLELEGRYEELLEKDAETYYYDNVREIAKLKEELERLKNGK